MAEVKWDALAKDLGEQGVAILKGVADEAGGDLKEFGLEIGRDMLSAVRAGDDEWERELRVQIKQLASINRIRLNEGAWAFAEVALASLVKVARGALLAGGLSL